MPLVPFATRLPISKRSYIRYKAMHTGIDIQDLVVEIIDFYQRHDSEFMKIFATLSPSSDSAKELGRDDQERHDEK